MLHENGLAGIEPATCKSQFQHPTTMPPCNNTSLSLTSNEDLLVYYAKGYGYKVLNDFDWLTTRLPDLYGQWSVNF